MPKDKDLKRLARRRMEKTGESYSTARAQLLKKKSPLPDDHARLAGMGDDAVRAKTGKTWEGWAGALDAVDAASWEHREIAEYIYGNFEGVSGWWAQMITVGYERMRGLRDVGQRRGGLYDVNKSKTVPVSVTRLFEAWIDERQRARWLPGVEVTIRTATPEKSLRMTWEDGTPVEAYFSAKSDDKSQVAVQHRKLPSNEAAEESREFWGERLAALAERLTEG